jgi:hypothetical protein
LEPGTFGTWNLEPGTRNQELLKPGTFGTWNQEPGTRNQKPGTWNLEQLEQIITK